MIPTPDLQRKPRTASPVLDVQGLRVEIQTEEGPIIPVDGVSLTVNPGEVVGLVGESGCGKSLTALAILGLLPQEAKIIGGRVVVGGELDLVAASDGIRDSVRGDVIAAVFQDPMSFLNPVIKIGRQIAEVLRVHEGSTRATAQRDAVDILASVGISDAARVASEYAHQLSGGMRQRVLIAMALACTPRLLIADEPFTALDVATEDRLIALLKEKKAELDLSILLITHDLGVAAEMCDRLYVMYAGAIVETGEIVGMYENAKHPYSQALIDCAQMYEHGEENDIPYIPGVVPSFFDVSPGCRFYPRCPKRMDICRDQFPGITPTGEDAWVKCWQYE